MRPVDLSVASAPSRPATAVLAGSYRASSPSDQTPNPIKPLTPRKQAVAFPTAEPCALC